MTASDDVMSADHAWSPLPRPSEANRWFASGRCPSCGVLTQRELIPDVHGYIFGCGHKVNGKHLWEAGR